MTKIIGIRREDKNKWESRTPLTPEHVKELIMNHDVKFIVQPSAIRAFSDESFRQAGAKIEEDLSKCDLVLAIKEIPLEEFHPDVTYLFFSHTIKGQSHNMPMLKKILTEKSNLLDYEKIVDEKNRRLIFFGNWAGYAGMMDTLWAFGKRLDYEGITNPFSSLRLTHEYGSLDEAKVAMREVGEKIRSEGLPDEITPLVIGLAGYGNVSGGAQEMIADLPVEEVDPKDIEKIFDNPSKSVVYKVVFKEWHMVKLKDPSSGEFELQDYYDHPEKYIGIFEQYIPHLSILINAIYWSAQYPRLFTKKYLKELYSQSSPPRLRVIGDISVDIEGAIEFTVRSTDPGNPVYVYNPFDGSTVDGVEGVGPVILAVDNLPCELPIDSSNTFSDRLRFFVPNLIKTDFTKDFKDLDLQSELKKAIIVYKGELTPNYRYLHKYLQ
ncbi:MAG: bifunctional lysine ketoglutarate reductase /saccharopine dehydrogenase family protein [Promethearchaeota archaeon]